jgi:hypothetical protein
MKIKLPHPLRKRRIVRDNVTRRLVMDVIHDIRDRPITVKHTVTHSPRPPAPRPSRLSIIWTMQNGYELRDYVPINGMWSHTANVPQWLVNPESYGGTPFSVRYEFGYTDGEKWKP